MNNCGNLNPLCWHINYYNATKRCSLPLSLWAVPLWVLLGGTCASLSLHHHFYNCTSPPLTHFPAPHNAGAMVQQEILNDEHIYPPEVKSGGLDQKCAASVCTRLRCTEDACSRHPGRHISANIMLGTCMLGEATLITSFPLQCAWMSISIHKSLLSAADLQLLGSSSSWSLSVSYTIASEINLYVRPESRDEHFGFKEYFLFKKTNEKKRGDRIYKHA